MFELYSENARRIFYARYEAHELGSREIQPEHLLLALFRDSDLFRRVLKGVSVEDLREEVLAQAAKGEKLPARVDLPLATESKRALVLASEEHESFSNKYIENDHLVLGLLRIEQSYPARLLEQKGLSVEDLRLQVATLERREPGATRPKISPENRFMLNTVRHVQNSARKRHSNFSMT